MFDITPIEKHGNLYFKRDDLFAFGGMNGAKVRACLNYVLQNPSYDTFVTLGAKNSPQINILASVCKEYKKKAVGFTTTSQLTEEMLSAQNKGAEIHQVPYGYTSNLISKAKKYAVENNALYIPFGMDSYESVELTKQQAQNILEYIKDIKRIVIPTGSSINLSGLLLFLIERNISIPVVAVRIGYKFDKLLIKYVSSYDSLEIVDAEQEYNKTAEFTTINGIEVDGTYEGKCIPFLQPNDLFWLIGKKETKISGKTKEI